MVWVGPLWCRWTAVFEVLWTVCWVAPPDLPEVPRQDLFFDSLLIYSCHLMSPMRKRRTEHSLLFVLCRPAISGRDADAISPLGAVLREDCAPRRSAPRHFRLPRGRRRQVTKIRCRAAQYEFLRAAMKYGGDGGPRRPVERPGGAGRCRRVRRRKASERALEAPYIKQ